MVSLFLTSSMAKRAYTAITEMIAIMIGIQMAACLRTMTLLLVLINVSSFVAPALAFTGAVVFARAIQNDTRVISQML